MRSRSPRPDLPVPITDTNLAHPPQPDAALYVRLSRVLGLPTNRQPCPVNGHGLLRMSEFACRVVQGYVQLSYGEATVASDITPQQLWYISERQAAFPGVSVQQIYQRTYPFGDVASQVLGIVSRITHSETLGLLLQGRQRERLGRPIRPRGVLRPLSTRGGRR